MTESSAVLEVNIKRSFQQTPGHYHGYDDDDDDDGDEDDGDDKPVMSVLPVITNNGSNYNNNRYHHNHFVQRLGDSAIYRQQQQQQQQQQQHQTNKQRTHQRIQQQQQHQQQDQHITYVCFAQNKMGNVSFKVSIPILEIADVGADNDDDDDDDRDGGLDKDGDLEAGSSARSKAKAKVKPGNSTESRGRQLFPPCSSFLRDKQKKVGACIEDHSAALDKEPKNDVEAKDTKIQDGAESRGSDNAKSTKEHANSVAENIDKEVVTNGSYLSSLMNGENQFTGSWTERKFTLPEIASAVVATHVTTMLVYAAILLFYYRRRAKWLRRKSSDNKGEHKNKNKDNKVVLNGDLFAERDGCKRNGYFRSNGFFGKFTAETEGTSKTTTLTKDMATAINNNNNSNSNNNNKRLGLCCQRRKPSPTRVYQRQQHQHQSHDYETFAQAFSPKLRRSMDWKGSSVFQARGPGATSHPPDLAEVSSDSGFGSKSQRRQFQVSSSNSPRQNPRHSSHLKDLQSIFASIPPPPLPLRAAPPSIPPPPPSSSSNLINPALFAHPYTLYSHQSPGGSDTSRQYHNEVSAAIQKQRHPLRQSLTPTPTKRFNFSPYTPEHRGHGQASSADESPWELMSARHLSQRSYPDPYNDNNEHYCDKIPHNSNSNNNNSNNNIFETVINSDDPAEKVMRPLFDTSRYCMNRNRTNPNAALTQNNDNHNNKPPPPTTTKTSHNNNNNNNNNKNNSSSSRSDEDNSNICGDSL